MEWSSHFSARMARMRASEIRELLKLLDRPDVISFAGGIPDPALFPAEELAAASQRILSDPARARAALQYSVSEGYLPLRQWIADYMGRRGLSCTADHVVITNGSQQALDFLGKLFITPGDTILTASPTYLGALQAFNAYEADYASLSEIAQVKAKFAYVMPDFENPTGTSLTLAEREVLIEASAAHSVPLVEDNAYDALRYDGEALPSLIALAAQRAGGIDRAHVISCGTFSKSIAPALRLGWIVAPRPVIEKLVLINQASDLHVSTFTQMLMYDIVSRIFDAHTSKIREVYKKRRDAMLAALEKYMPDSVSWTRPEGGMFVWLTLPSGIDAAVLLQRAIESAHVAFVPGAAFYPDRAGRNTLRMSFALNEPDRAAEGVRRLAGLIPKS
ncbi:MAG: PLP-dependent aminotransferase family protein [Alphaproteobacteria bacterium]|nr:PLP-dependent aminotransferase family protein [Alphaproteobacteria bacterium]